MGQVVFLSGAKIAVWIGQAIVYSALVGTELPPMACPDLCDERLVCSAFQALIVLQLVVVVDCLALLMFDWGVGYVSSDQLLGCAEADSSVGGIELCGLFGCLVSKFIPWEVHACRHPGDVNVCWQLLQGSFQGGNLSKVGVH